MKIAILLFISFGSLIAMEKSVADAASQSWSGGKNLQGVVQKVNACLGIKDDCDRCRLVREQFRALSQIIEKSEKAWMLGEGADARAQFRNEIVCLYKLGVSQSGLMKALELIFPNGFPESLGSEAVKEAEKIYTRLRRVLYTQLQQDLEEAMRQYSVSNVREVSQCRSRRPKNDLLNRLREEFVSREEFERFREEFERFGEELRGQRAQFREELRGQRAQFFERFQERLDATTARAELHDASMSIAEAWRSLDRIARSLDRIANMQTQIAQQVARNDESLAEAQRDAFERNRAFMSETRTVQEPPREGSLPGSEKQAQAQAVSVDNGEAKSVAECRVEEEKVFDSEPKIEIVFKEEAKTSLKEKVGGIFGTKLLRIAALVGVVGGVLIWKYFARKKDVSQKNC